MAGSKYAYVKSFELPDHLLPNTFIVFRVDGHSFHRFTDVHGFEKPNDERGLRLMDHVAQELMAEYKDIVFAFGESDEYSFLLRRSTALYNRRHSKILSTLTSYFTAAYIMHWNDYFPDTSLKIPPTFDGRLILYPGVKEVRDYFSWRQTDTHINNLYNTVFWALIKQGGQSTTEVHGILRGTVSSQKHEILFSRFGINYNNLPARYRKGSSIVREEFIEVSSTKEVVPESTSVTTEVTKETEIQVEKEAVHRLVSKTKTTPKTRCKILHVDIIGDEFWNSRPTILAD